MSCTLLTLVDMPVVSPCQPGAASSLVRRPDSTAGCSLLTRGDGFRFAGGLGGGAVAACGDVAGGRIDFGRIDFSVRRSSPIRKSPTMETPRFTKTSVRKSRATPTRPLFA